MSGWRWRFGSAAKPISAMSVSTSSSSSDNTRTFYTALSCLEMSSYSSFFSPVATVI
jgi:hypothetical protein